MAITTALLVCLAIKMTFAEKCPNPAICPCGNYNDTTCDPSSVDAEACAQLSDCEPCKDNTTFCAKCPEGLKVPTCSRATTTNESKDCADPSPLKFGISECDTVENETSCKFTCFDGFYLSGTDKEKEMTLTCREGVWSTRTSFPDCIPTGECDYARPEEGRTNCTIYRTYVTCDVWCDRNYRGRFKCYPGRPWEPRLPPCLTPNILFKEHGVYCYHPGLTPNARMQYFAPGNSDPELYEIHWFPEGSEVEYTCEEGFRIQEGSGRLRCEANGTWSEVTPICVPDADDCDFFNQTAVEANCTGDTNGTRCDVSCGNEYMGRFFCYPGRGWEPTLPLCVTMKVEFNNASYCDNPGPISFGEVQYFAPGRGDRLDPEIEKFPEGSLVEYTCDDGYMLHGFRRLTCMTTGDWTSLKPTCAEVPAAAESKKCPDAALPRFSTSKCDSVLGDGRSCNVTCFNNYYFKGTDKEREITLTCKDGVWTPRTSCIHTGECAYHRQQAGRSNCTAHTLYTSCDVWCDHNYMGQFKCYPGRAWEPRLPPCLIPNPAFKQHGAVCTHPGRIPNVRMLYFASDNSSDPILYEMDYFQEGSVVEYTCDEGLRIQEGSGRLTCEKSGNWSEVLPICAPVISDTVKVCKNPRGVSGGSVQLQWPVTLPFTPRLYPAGSGLKYSCNPGHRLIGERVIVCLKSGEWTASPPKCIPNVGTSGRRYCLYPGDVVNGQVEYIAIQNQPMRLPSTGDREEYPEGSRLRYSCDEGYTPDGPATLTCESSGSWSPAVPPTCINADDNYLVNCQNLGRLRNGSVWYFAPGVRKGIGMKLDTDLEEYPEGSTLEYACDEGFWLEGSRSLVCDSEGFWSERKPTCVRNCGQSFVKSTVPTRNDQESESAVWPWVVSISVQGKNGTGFVCSGAVFNSRAVVTAAHCLEMDRTYILRFGKHHYKVEDDDTRVLNRTSSRVIIHPDYSRKTFDSDIALIVFDPPIEYSTSVQPICMPSVETTITNIKPGNVGFVSGWGPTESDPKSDSQLFVGLPVLRMRFCAESYIRQNLTITVTGNMFCAGHLNKTYSVCKGDGGSPLVFYDKISQRYTLEGLVSFVFGRLTDAQVCGLPGRFAIFTKVSRFVPWMYESVQ